MFRVAATFAEPVQLLSWALLVDSNLGIQGLKWFRLKAPAGRYELLAAAPLSVPASKRQPETRSDPWRFAFYWLFVAVLPMFWEAPGSTKPPLYSICIGALVMYVRLIKSCDVQISVGPCSSYTNHVSLKQKTCPPPKKKKGGGEFYY